MSSNNYKFSFTLTFYFSFKKKNENLNKQNASKVIVFFTLKNSASGQNTHPVCPMLTSAFHLTTVMNILVLYFHDITHTKSQAK